MTFTPFAAPCIVIGTLSVLKKSLFVCRMRKVEKKLKPICPQYGRLISCCIRSTVGLPQNHLCKDSSLSSGGYLLFCRSLPTRGYPKGFHFPILTHQQISDHRKANFAEVGSANRGMISQSSDFFCKAPTTCVN